MRKLILSGTILLLLSPRAVHASTVTVTVMWDSPGDPAVVGYVISYGTASGSYTSEVPVGDVVSKIVTLPSDTDTYYFIVQSVDGTGRRSDPTGEVTYSGSFSIACRITNAVSPDGNPVAVTLLDPIIVGGTPPPDHAVCLPASGSLFPVGDTPETCTASDATRTVSCQSVVRVTYQPSDAVRLTASPGILLSGSRLTVKWTASAGRPVYDWIGLFPVGGTNIDDYMWWIYTNGAAVGGVTIPAPPAGTYEFRYLVNDGYNSVGKSNPVTVTR